MSRLIDADALIERMRKYIDGDWHRNLGAVFTHGVEACINFAEEARTIEAVPVVHGEWIDVTPHGKNKRWKFDGVYKCSNCEKMYEDNRYSFCPNCGAKMEGGA